jgi:hypothetical protein
MGLFYGLCWPLDFTLKPLMSNAGRMYSVSSSLQMLTRPPEGDTWA